MPTKRKGGAKSAAPSKRAKPGKWSAENVLQNPKGPLAYANLRNVFSQPEAFSSLTDEQKATLASLMPEERIEISNDNGEITINQHFLNYDPDFQHALSRVQEDIVEGRNDAEWLKQAIAAHEERKKGEFDSYKDAEFEAFWGQKQKLPHHVIAGSSANVPLQELFKKNLLRKGDVWAYNRKVMGPNGEGILFEKETMITDVSSDGEPTISIPPGQYKMSNPSREDIILVKIKAPGALNAAIIEHDDRISGAPSVSAWKLIRVIRANQDLGTLWDIRQAYHFSYEG